LANNYVDNRKLTKELGEWAKRVREQIKNGETPERMPEYIGECVYLICTNISYKSSFINYTYKDDMISDAIENCVRYIKNFDGDNNDNAFGYISTIAYYAFIRRIKKENKRHTDHLNYIRNSFAEDEIREALNADNPNDVKGYLTYIDYMQSILDMMDVELPTIEEVVKKPKKEVKTAIDDIFSGKF